MTTHEPSAPRPISERLLTGPQLPTYPSSQPAPDVPVSIQLASQHASLVYPDFQRQLAPYSRELRRIKSSLDILSHICPFCWLLQEDPANADHLLQNCTRCPNIYTTHQHQWNTWFPLLKFSPGHCFGCGCPQHVSSTI